jgi:hypothetical protein
MDWDKSVPAIFQSPHFASHPADEKRAFEWLADLRARGVGWKAASQQLKAYMTSKGWQKKHIQKQLLKARLMMKPWLLD